MNSAHTLTEPKNYSSIFGNIINDDTESHCFAAANSKNGFVSFFDSVFSPEKIETLYILGGGPGCGKSTLMKKVATLAKEKGYKTEHIHCSSSPDSLDGVIIKEKKTAVIDGTSPHTYLPSNPGVREINVDLGRAWDTTALSNRKEAITYLSAAKKKAYKKAYIYLRATGLLAEDEAQFAFSHTLCEKLSKNVSAIFEKELCPKSKNTSHTHFSPDIRLQRAVSCKGNVYFDSFSALAQKTFLVTDYRGISALWFKKLYELAHDKKLDIAVSYSPEDPSVIDGIFFKNQSIAFTLYADEPYKNINCARFAEKEHFSNIKSRHSFIAKSVDSLLRESYDALFAAGEYHKKIEEEYFPCTDFGITQQITQDVCKKIFG